MFNFVIQSYFDWIVSYIGNYRYMQGKEINLAEVLKVHFGFDTFKGEQEAIIRNLLAGNDTFVLMPTGAAGARRIRSHDVRRTCLLRLR